VIASVFHRRRAERFAQLIDEASGGRRHHVRSAVDGDLTDLVAVHQRLSDLPLRVEAHPEFRDGLRAMLLATIERDGIGATAAAPEPEPGRRWVRAGSRRRPAGARPPMARRTKARGAIVIGLAAGTLALSGMSAASGDAIPGDPLYSVKRSTERAQLALAGSDNSRAALYLEFARTRLDEAQAVRTDVAGLSGVLDDMDSETRQGVRLLTAAAVDHKDGATLDQVDTFATAQRAATARLREGLTGPARSRANASLTLLDDILRRSKDLRKVLSCGTAATSAADALGPQVKAPCRVNGERTTNPVAPQSSGNQESPSGTPSANQPAQPAEVGSPAGPSASPSNPGGLLGDVRDIVGG
jgi:hypothetical protein